jgi:hypothetical protein
MTAGSGLQPAMRSEDLRAQDLSGDRSPVTVAPATQSDGQAWDAFVASQEDASGYHVWAWRGVFERAFGHKAIYLLARRGTSIQGVLPLVQINSRLFGRTMTS